MTDRDRRTPLVPPPQVRAQTAKPIDSPVEQPDSWEDQSGDSIVPTGVKTLVPATGETKVDVVVRRSGETKQAIMGPGGLEDRVTNLEAKVDTVVAKVTTGEVQNDKIIGILLKQNETMLNATLHRQEMSGLLHTKTTETELRIGEAKQLAANEVEKTGKVASIEVRKKAWMTALGIVGAVAGGSAFIGWVLQSCGGG